MLILPNDPEFSISPTECWHLLGTKDNKGGVRKCVVYDHETGLPRAASESEAWDYILGGEYDERLANQSNQVVILAEENPESESGLVYF